jgi:hypothetical protein
MQQSAGLPNVGSAVPCNPRCRNSRRGAPRPGRQRCDLDSPVKNAATFRQHCIARRHLMSNTVRDPVRRWASFNSLAGDGFERGRGPAAATRRGGMKLRECCCDGRFRSHLRASDWLTLQSRLIKSESEKRPDFSRGSALLATFPQGALALLKPSASAAVVRRVHGEADHGR